jgi:hypothetical protein
MFVPVAPARRATCTSPTRSAWLPNSLVSRNRSWLPATLVWTTCRIVSLLSAGVEVAGVAVGTLAQVPTQLARGGVPPVAPSATVAPDSAIARPARTVTKRLDMVISRAAPGG